MNREHMMFWQLAFAAATMSGKSIQIATQTADQALAAFKSRFPEDKDD